MHLTAILSFKKSINALNNLEKLLTCKECNQFCRNPRRHAECGNLLCACSATESGTCPYCSGRYSLSNTSPDWHLNSIIEATKRIKDLIHGTSSNEDKDSGEAKCSVEGKEKEKTSSGNNMKKDVETNIASNVTSRKSVKELHSKQLSHDPSANDKGNGCNSKTSSRFSKDSKKEEHRPSRIDQSKKVNDLSIVKSIMKRNAKGETRLHSACIKSDVKKVEEFLAAGADPCTKDNAGWTPLHEAVSKGNLKIVRLLLEAGAMVNVPGGYNNTPLHDAVLGNYLDIARLLIAFGADPDIKNIEGFTPRSMVQSGEMDSLLKESTPLKTASMKERRKVDLKEKVIFSVNLPLKDQEYLNAVNRCFKIKLTSIQSDASHFVVAAVNRKCIPTFDIFYGILKGKWIVDSKWLQSSLNDSKLIDPTEFEVTGTNNFPNSGAPNKSRLNGEKMQPSLFNGFHIYFSGVDKVVYNDIKLTKSQLTTLVTCGDGVVLTREPNPEAIPPKECTVPYHAGSGVFEKCSHLIIYQPGRNEPLLKYNMTHVKSLPVSWLLKCIETFELIEP